MRFQKLTRGGEECRIYAFEDTCADFIHGAIKDKNIGKWRPVIWGSTGKMYGQKEDKDDLIPITEEE